MDNPGVTIKRCSSVLAGLLLLGGCTPSLPLAGGNPADAAAPGPAFRYETPFAGYVQFKPVEPGPWREMNDRVRRLGGAGGHMNAESENDPLPEPK